ncbi:Spore coat protein F precursor [compost metagenome]
MNNDYLDPINSLGTPELADTTFAMDFLIRAKEGVRNYAIALTETASPEARAILRDQMYEGLELHDEIAKLMISKKWFHPYKLDAQYNLDMTSAKTTLQIAQMKLYPDNTNRKGVFDRTPE